MPNVHDDLEAYTTWLHCRGLSPNTVEHRRRVLAARLREWGPLEEVSISTIMTWLQGHSGWTRSSYFAVFSSAFDWLLEVGRVDSNPFRSMKRPKAPKSQPRPLSEEELARVLGAAVGRTRAFLLLGYLAGLRAHEVAKIHGRDVDEQRIRVVGKGGVDATVPTHPLLWEVAQTYPRDGYWFPPQISSNSKSQHVGAEVVTSEVRALFRSLGIEGSSHRARHTYATTLLRAGTNLRVVQELMRHSTLETTAAYLGVSDEERATAVQGLSVAAPVAAASFVVASEPAAPAAPVSSADVMLVAEVLDELEIELLRMPDDEARVLFDRGFNAVIAARAAERTGRYGDVEQLEAVTWLLVNGRVSSEPAIVECRTASCASRRTPTLDLPGTTCEGCGRPRARAVGPVAGPECPPWCQTHPVETSTEYVHSGEVSSTVDLEQAVTLDDEGRVVVGPVQVVVWGDDGPAKVDPADALGAVRLAGAAGRPHAAG